MAPTRWNSVLDALEFGNRCAQVNTLGVFSTDSSQEDCLYLSVYTPLAVDNESLLPVMVWIHGGGLAMGSGNDYVPRRLVVRGNVIVVTMNYRLGVFGFLAQSDIDREGHPFGNYGLMDQQFALKWVQENIRMFGGDPHNVTLFGQSAGASAVTAHIASPSARGLFQRAIAQSNATDVPVTTLERAQTMGSALAQALECNELPADCMRTRSTEQLLEANRGKSPGSEGPFFPFLILDGNIIPAQPHELFSAGLFNRVPLINGATRDEGTFDAALDEVSSKHVMTASEYGAAVRALYPDTGARVLEQYRLKDFDSPAEAYGAALTDQRYCLGLAFTGSYQRFVPNTYLYEFADRTAPSYLPTISFAYGASHTFELPYLFDGFHGVHGGLPKLTRPQLSLADQMVDYWASFARFGDPSQGGNGKPENLWRPYTARGREYLSFELPNAMRKRGPPPGHRCDFWDALAK
jgi:para-nitrobenzyl esterase